MPKTAHYSAEQVNHFLAAQQHLVPGTEGRGSVLPLVRDLVALHATSPRTPYLSLWARMQSFRREELDKALYLRKSLARLVCMRDSLFIVPASEYATFFRAYNRRARSRPAREEQLLRTAGLGKGKQERALAVELRRRVMAIMADGRPRTVSELTELIPELASRLTLSRDTAWEANVSLGARFVPGLAAYGDLTRGRSRGGWRSYRWEWVSLKHWLPQVDLEAESAEPPHVWLLRRYFDRFGPASREDAAWWAGLGKGAVAQALDELGDELCEITLEGSSQPLLLSKGQLRRLRRFPPPTEPYVFLLPELDPYIMGYKQRGRFLRPEYAKRCFDAVGNARPTIWADGRVVGSWRALVNQQPTFELFEPLSEPAQRQLEDRLNALTNFLNA